MRRYMYLSYFTSASIKQFDKVYYKKRAGGSSSGSLRGRLGVGRMAWEAERRTMERLGIIKDASHVKRQEILRETGG